jgi:NADP-dependent 3-hydroxy acid dehydrogenase YdfG
VLLLGRDLPALEALRSEIEGANGTAVIAVANATDSAGMQLAVQSLQAASGPIDSLVNTVGVNVPRRSLEELAEEDWRRVIDVNLTSAHVLQQAVLPGMREARDGVIIHIASVAAKAADLSGVAYQASKAGLGALARAAGREAAPDGVRISTIYPGLIDTGFVRHRKQPPSPAELEHALTPEDVSAVCLTILGLPVHAHVVEVVMTPTFS